MDQECLRISMENSPSPRWPCSRSGSLSWAVGSPDPPLREAGRIPGANIAQTWHVLAFRKPPRAALGRAWPEGAGYAPVCWKAEVGPWRVLSQAQEDTKIGQRSSRPRCLRASMGLETEPGGGGWGRGQTHPYLPEQLRLHLLHNFI